MEHRTKSSPPIRKYSEKCGFVGLCFPWEQASKTLPACHRDKNDFLKSSRFTRNLAQERMIFYCRLRLGIPLFTNVQERLRKPIMGSRPAHPGWRYVQDCGPLGGN